MLRATTSTWTTLGQAEALAEALGNKDLVVVDCRVSLADRGAGERLWRESHIPGAVYADLERDLSDMRREGEGRHPWPDAVDFTARPGAWGISARSEAHTPELQSLLRISYAVFCLPKKTRCKP